MSFLIGLVIGWAVLDMIFSVLSTGKKIEVTPPVVVLIVTMRIIIILVALEARS